MKKLSLGKLKLASEEILHRGQLAEIYGGSSSGPGKKYKCCTTGGCSDCVTCNSPCTCQLGTLTAC